MQVKGFCLVVGTLSSCSSSRSSSMSTSWILGRGVLISSRFSFFGVWSLSWWAGGTSQGSHCHQSVKYRLLMWRAGRWKALYKHSPWMWISSVTTEQLKRVTTWVLGFMKNTHICRCAAYFSSNEESTVLDSILIFWQYHLDDTPTVQQRQFNERVLPGSRRLAGIQIRRCRQLAAHMATCSPRPTNTEAKKDVKLKTLFKPK